MQLKALGFLQAFEESADGLCFHVFAMIQFQTFIYICIEVVSTKATKLNQSSKINRKSISRNTTHLHY